MVPTRLSDPSEAYFHINPRYRTTVEDGAGGTSLFATFCAEQKVVHIKLLILSKLANKDENVK